MYRYKQETNKETRFKVVSAIVCNNNQNMKMLSALAKIRSHKLCEKVHRVIKITQQSNSQSVVMT